MGKKKVVIINTSIVSVEDLKNLFSEIVPEAEVINIIDESLLREVLANKRVTEGVTKRMCAYALLAEEMGADLIFNQCSSVGEVVDVAEKMLKVPYIKVDKPMAEKAAQIGGKIAVVATVKTTLGPTVRLIEKTAKEKGAELEIKEALIEGAFDVLMSGDKEKHNEMIIGTIEKLQDECDAIVLAQGSMICLLPQLEHIKVPVLSSPRSGVEGARKVLGL